MNWEIRKSGKCVLKSPVEKCGYSDQTLKSLKQAGYILYCDGKKHAKK